VREEFINKQDYAEETDGSSLNNSECEISSEDELVKKKYNKDSECIKPISVKRKICLSDNNKSTKKSKKTIYMESFDLKPCAATADKLNVSKEKSNIDKTDKNTLDFDDSNTNTADEIIDIDAETVPYNSSENINNSKKIIDSNISVQEGSISGTECDGTLVIDEVVNKINVNDSDDSLVSKNTQKNEVQSATTEDNLMNISTETIDIKSNDPIITEPIVEINEDKDSEIELNELDDSDIEITSCDTPRVPVQNKKSLENIIKASMFKKNKNNLYGFYLQYLGFLFLVNFEKKYKFGQNQPSMRHPSMNVPLRVSKVIILVYFLYNISS
jgi:hypothetical protein